MHAKETWVGMKETSQTSFCKSLRRWILWFI